MSSAGAAPGGVRWVWTGSSDGDLRVPPADASPHDVRAYESRIGRLAGGRDVTWLRQVHGAGVLRVDHAGQGRGRVADAAVTSCTGAALAVLTADCAPVLLHGRAGGIPVLAVAHAGWRGLLGGVLQSAVAAMESLAGGPFDSPVVAVLGPCIGPECYQFGARDLAMLVARFGPSVESRTAGGSPALDLRAGVAAALQSVGVEVSMAETVCTACDRQQWFSHRRGGDRGRQALLAWLESV